MQVLIQSPFDLTDSKKEYINTTIDKLTQLEHRITQAEVYFKASDGNEVNSITATVRLHIPGEDAVGSSEDQDAMVAFNEAAGKVKRQLIKAKELRKNY